MSLDATSELSAAGAAAAALGGPSAAQPSQPLRKPLLKLRPKSGWAALDLRDLWQFRDLLFALAARDVRLRYKQTALGIAWVILQPVLAAGILTFVFGTIAKLDSNFILVYAGLLGWNLFNGMLTRCSTSLTGNAHLISKVFFPRLVLPFSTIPSALIDFAVAMMLMVVLMIAKGALPGVQIVMFPVWLALLVMLSLGLGLWTSALTVSYRDVQYILPVVLQLLLYASPVAYPISKVPAHLMTPYHLNPLVSVIGGLRWSLLPNVDAPQWGFVAYSAAVTLAIVISGAFAFKRMERRFADVI